MSLQGNVLNEAPAPSALGVDYSFARPTPADIVAAGYKFVVRYVAPASEASKALSASEAQALHAAGISILLTFEDGASNALYGATQGAIDGAIAKAAAQALGYPQNVTIFFAVDFDAQPNQIPAIDAYYTACATACAPYPAGTYGKTNIAMPNAEYWESEAWDGTSVAGTASLYQRVSPTVAHPIQGTDEVVLLKSIPMWDPVAPTPNPAPASGPSSSSPIVATVACATGGYWQACADGGVFTFGQAGFYGSAFGMSDKPIQGMAASSSGKGYALWSQDGLFCFGDFRYGGRVSVN